MAIGIQPAGGEGGDEPGHLAHQAVQFQIFQLLLQSVRVHRAQLQDGLLRERDVHQDLGQLARQVGVVAVRAELAFERPFHRSAAGFRPFGFNLGQHLVDPIKVVVFFEQVDRCLRADPFHPGDVVGAVAGEGLEIHHLVGHHAQLGHHARLINQGWTTAACIRSSPHVHHGDVALVIHQLEEVAIAAEDAHAPAGLGSAVGQSAQHIVGLKSWSQAERQLQELAQDSLQLIQVLEEHLRRHIAMGLVVGIGFVPEGGFCSVKGNGDTLRLQPFAVIQQCLEKAIGDAGGPAILGGQPTVTSLAEGVEAAEGQGMAIHQQQQRFLLGVRHGFGQVRCQSVARLRPGRHVNEHPGAG